MKTLLLIAFVILSITLSAQTATSTVTNSAQTELDEFELRFGGIKWNTMSNEQIIQLIVNHYKLMAKVKLVSKKEKIVNDSIQSIRLDNNIKESKKQLKKQIEYLQNKGFKCDNSIEDWLKLYNNPERQGANWKKRATIEFERNDLNNFIQKANEELR